MNTALRLFVLLALVGWASVSAAQWSADPAVNLPLGDGPGDQVVPHIVTGSDGSCFTGWYSNGSGNYDVALQHLAADGTELWPHGGIFVSTHPQNSWVMDWALIADAAGNAIVAFADIRGGQSNIHIYKIAPDGTFVWGPDGIDITSNSDDKGPPSLAETNDGDIVIAWYAGPSVGNPAIRIQRLAPDGTLRYGANGLAASEPADTFPSGAVMVPCGEDGFILGYVPVYSFMANRQIKAQRFDAAGQSVWADYLMVMDDATVPMGHYFNMMSDGQDGAFFSWTVATGLNFTVRAQHLDSDGVESYTHNGLLVSTEPAYAQISPDMTFDAAAGELTVLYIQQDGNQTLKGIFGQRISLAGDRLWSETGAQILPVNTTNEGFVRALDTGDGVIGLSFQAPQNAYGQDQVIGFKVGTDGHLAWDPTIVGVSTLPSSKDDLMAVMGTGGSARAIWADERDGDYDIYGQNLNGDGTLGPLAVPALDTPFAMFHLEQNHPNPFNPATDINFSLARREHVLLRIYDTKGSLVRTLLDDETGPGPQSLRWNGRNNAGASMPSGVYFYRLDTRDGRQVRKMVMIR